MFREIVNSLGEGYLPHNFTNMIIYLVYMCKREELRKTVEQKPGIKEKIGSIESLLKLKDLTHNNEKLNIHADNFKHNLKNKFRDIWEQVNERYGQKFPCTPNLEAEFYEHYRRARER